MEFTRTIESFAPTTPVIAAEFDASLKGAGLIWFAREGGTEVALGVCAVDLSFLEFGDDPSYQNLAEFTGARSRRADYTRTFRKGAGAERGQHNGQHMGFHGETEGLHRYQCVHGMDPAMPCGRRQRDRSHTHSGSR